MVGFDSFVFADMTQEEFNRFTGLVFVVSFFIGMVVGCLIATGVFLL